MNFFASKSERRSRPLQLENLENRELLDAAGLGTLNTPDYNPAIVLGNDAERIAAPALVAAAAVAAQADPPVKVELADKSETNAANVTWTAVAGSTKYTVQYKELGADKWKTGKSVKIGTTAELKLTAGKTFDIQVISSGIKGTADKLVGTAKVTTWAEAVAPTLKKPTATELKILTQNGFRSNSHIAVKVANYTNDVTHTLFKGENYTSVNTLDVIGNFGTFSLKYNDGTHTWDIAENGTTTVKFANGFIVISGLTQKTPYKLSVQFRNTTDGSQATTKKPSATSAATTKPVIIAPENVFVQPTESESTNSLTVTWDASILSGSTTPYGGLYNVTVYDASGKKVAATGGSKVQGTQATLVLKRPVAGATYTVTVTPVGDSNYAKPVEGTPVRGDLATDANTPIFRKPDLTTTQGAAILTVINKDKLPAAGFSVVYSHNGNSITEALNAANGWKSGNVSYNDADGTITVAGLKHAAVYELTTSVAGYVLFATAKGTWETVKADDIGIWSVTSTTASVWFPAALDSAANRYADYIVKVYETSKAAPVQTIAASADQNGDVDIDLTGLTPNTEYAVTVTAESDVAYSAGTESAKSETFRTNLAAPTLTFDESAKGPNSLTFDVDGYVPTAAALNGQAVNRLDITIGNSFAGYIYNATRQLWIYQGGWGSITATFIGNKLTISGLNEDTEYNTSVRFWSGVAGFDVAEVSGKTKDILDITLSPVGTPTNHSVKFTLNELVNDRTIDGTDIDQIVVEDSNSGLTGTLTRSGSIWASDVGNVLTFKNGVIEVSGNILTEGTNYNLSVTAKNIEAGLTFGPATLPIQTIPSPVTFSNVTAANNSITFNIAGYATPGTPGDLPKINGEEVSVIDIYYTGGGGNSSRLTWSAGAWRTDWGTATFTGTNLVLAGLAAGTDYTVTFSFSGSAVTWRRVDVQRTTTGNKPKAQNDYVPPTLTPNIGGTKANELSFNVSGLTGQVIDGVKVNSFMVNVNDVAVSRFNYITGAWTNWGWIQETTFNGTTLVIKGLQEDTAYSIDVVFSVDNTDPAFGVVNTFATNTIVGRTSNVIDFVPNIIESTQTSIMLSLPGFDWTTLIADGQLVNDIEIKVTNAAGITVVDGLLAKGKTTDPWAWSKVGGTGKVALTATNLLEITGLTKDTVYDISVQLGVYDRINAAGYTFRFGKQVLFGVPTKP